MAMRRWARGTRAAWASLKGCAQKRPLEARSSVRSGVNCGLSIPAGARFDSALFSVSEGRAVSGGADIPGYKSGQSGCAAKAFSSVVNSSRSGRRRGYVMHFHRDVPDEFGAIVARRGQLLGLSASAMSTGETGAVGPSIWRYSASSASPLAIANVLQNSNRGRPRAAFCGMRPAHPRRAMSHGTPVTLKFNELVKGIHMYALYAVWKPA
jgi:hypothetical protein